jgi:hypothetical protein
MNAYLIAISGLAKTGQAKSVQSVPKSPIFELGAPCTTLTDLREGTCNLEVRNDKRAFRRDMMILGE